MITLKSPYVSTKRFVIFDSTSGEISSIVNYKPTDGSFIPVEQKEVDSILTGNEPMSYYYVHYNKTKKEYQLRTRTNFDIDSYLVDDLIYEIPQDNIDNSDIKVTFNIKDTCWKFTIGGDLKANILAHKVSFKQIMNFSITKHNDPNILYKTISFNFDDLVDGKYVVVPFDSDFEFNGDPMSVYTIKRFDKYNLEVIR
jgi:hypothetical protein|tara:strand:- start:4754 stop:5347 length:594 start_codon:yes stop_codon:yes gene_type:complete